MKRNVRDADNDSAEREESIVRGDAEHVARQRGRD